MISTIDLLDWSLKKFWRERNIFPCLHSAFTVVIENNREIRKECKKLTFFFLSAKKDIERVLLIAEQRGKWSIHFDGIGTVDCVWDDIKRSDDVYLLTNNSIPELFFYLTPNSSVKLE